MAFREALFYALDKSVDQYGQTAFQKKTGIHQPTFHGIFSRKNTNPQLKAVEAIINNLDTQTFIDFIKSIRPELPIDVINMENKHEVPAYDISDLNTVMVGISEEKTRESCVLAMHELKPLFRVRVPEKYFPGDFAVLQAGHSMEPDIPHASAVGLAMLKSDRDFVAGETYLCYLPYEGLVLRRVVVVPGQDALEFQTIHINRDAYRSQIMHPNEAIPLIYARLTWIAHRK